MALDGEKIKGQAVGAFAGNEGSAAEKTRAQQVVVGRPLHIPVTTTANTDSQHGICSIPYALKVLGATYVAHTGAQASAAADGWQFTIKYDDGAGGASTAVTSAMTTATVPIVAGTRRSFALTNSAPVTIPAGSRVFVLADATNTAATANAIIGSVSLNCEEL